MPNIIDVILHKNDYGTQTMVVIDKPLRLAYERDGSLLIADDEGWLGAYRLEHDRYAKAFAGREFEIPMLDGTAVKANGQWWDTLHPRHKEATYVGVATIAELEQCYVFCSGSVLTSKLQRLITTSTTRDGSQSPSKTRSTSQPVTHSPRSTHPSDPQSNPPPKKHLRQLAFREFRRDAFHP